MMRKFGFIGCVLLLLVGGGGLLVWSVGSSAKLDDADKAEVLRSRRVIRDASKEKDRKKVKRRQEKKVDAGDVPRHVKPDISLESEDEAKLTGEMKRLYVELQAALDVNDRKNVFALVRRMKKMDEWPDDIPQSVKLKALEALKWCGSSEGGGGLSGIRSGLTEVASFAADADATVQQESVEVLTEMLSDASIGDRATSAIVTELASLLTDADALDTLMMELNNMRNSVKAETARSIYGSGNSVAVKVLDENIEFLFAGVDVDVQGEGDLDAFLKANPDDPDDEEIYGPQTF